MFWAAVLVFYTVYYGRESGEYRQSFLFVCLLLPVAIATTAVLGEVLMPRYLMRRRYGLFALYAGYTAVGSVYLELVVLVVFYIFVAEYQIDAIDPTALDVLDLIVGLYLIVFLALCIQLGRRWYFAQTLQARAQQARLEAELKLREAELALLKAQIQPHFLFNTLNNLYGLTLEKSEAAPEVVLQLSDLLDYVLYRSSAERVPVEDEIAFIRNYVELEQLRYDERLEVTFESDGIPEEATVAPLLMIPFVENSFKHGIRPSLGRTWLKVKLAVHESHLYVYIENSKPDGAPAGRVESAAKGLGLDNVQRRLDLLYPGRHELKIEDGPDRFAVRLHLKIDRVYD